MHSCSFIYVVLPVTHSTCQISSTLLFLDGGSQSELTVSSTTATESSGTEAMYVSKGKPRYSLFKSTVTSYDILVISPFY